MEIKFDEIVASIELEMLTMALETTEGNRANASKLLGISYRSFRHYAAKHKIVGSIHRDQQKDNARTLVGLAIKDGRLVRPSSCAHCGSTGPIQGHHPDYSKPLEVIWLCQPCHALEHSLIKQRNRLQEHSQ